MRRPVRWIHLSDLHTGCRGRELRWEVYEELTKSVRQMTDRLGPPDLVLISGDLTNTGVGAEFAPVTEFLRNLLTWLGVPGQQSIRDLRDGPVIIPVPGNHDLLRPADDAASPYQLLDNYDDDGDTDVRSLKRQLWEEKNAALFDPLFSAYRNWFEDHIRPQLMRSGWVSSHVSHFPGDLCVRIEPKDSFPLCVVGLNSAWRQYRAGDFERKLTVSLQQFHAALPQDPDSSPLKVFDDCRQSLLLCHHPPGWLSPRAYQAFNEMIFKPDRFSICLHGHMHAARSEGAVFDAGPPRFYFQAPSLFGLEHYGRANESRRMGYAWGTISEDGTVRVWPLVWMVQGGVATFVPDPAFPDSAAPDGVQIRPIAWVPGSGSGPPPGKSGTDAATRRYLEAVVASFEAENSGDWQRDLLAFYVDPRGSSEPPAEDPSAAMRAADLRELVEPFLRDGRSVAVLAQFGIGKTWFLRSLLYRTAKGMIESGATGLERVPLLVDLRIFRRAQPSLWERLLVRQPASFFEQVRKEAWKRAFGESYVSAHHAELQQLFESGRFLFLLDGLDEMSRAEAETLLSDLATINSYTYRSPVLMACRREFFPDIALEKGLAGKGFAVIYLWPWSLEQVRLYADQAHQKGRCKVTAAEVLTIIGSQYGLADLVTRALLAAMLVNQWDRIDWRDAASFSLPALYQRHIESALSLWQGARGQELTMDQLQRCMEEMADLMFQGDTRALTREDLDKHLERQLGLRKFSTIADRVAHELTTNSFLVRQDTGQGTRYAFCHASFCEFLVARKIAGAIRRNDLSALSRLGHSKEFRSSIDPFLRRMLSDDEKARLLPVCQSATPLQA